MPTYTYRRADGTTFDVFQKMSDAPLAEDPETGQPVTRMISGGAGLQFKGSGFYLTDYVKKTGGEGSESGGDKAGSDKDSGSKESKTSGAKDSAKADAPKAASKPTSTSSKNGSGS